MERFIVNLSKDSDKYTAVYEVKKNSRSIRAGEDVKYLTNADINEAVYAAMKKAGQEVVDRCQVYMSGERTASELAGHVNKYLHAVDVTIHEKHVDVPKSVKVVVGDLFTCCIATDDLFAMMADWEGMMGLKQKDCHRFYCQCDAKADRSKEMTPYKRSVYTAGRVSIAAENQRIYKDLKEHVDDGTLHTFLTFGWPKLPEKKAAVKPDAKTEYTPEFLANTLRQTLIKLAA